MPFRSSSLEVVPKAQTAAWNGWVLWAPEIWDPHKVFVTFVPSPLFFLYLFICSFFSVSFSLLISPFLSILPFLVSVFSRGRWGREACWHHSLFLFLPASCPMFFLLNPTFLTHSPRHFVAVIQNKPHGPIWISSLLLRGDQGPTWMLVTAGRPHTCSLPHLPFLKVLLL